MGEDIIVPFTAAEFYIVNGLQHYGLSVDLHSKLPSSTLEEFFDNDVRSCTKDNIAAIMRVLVQRTNKSDVEDFCRMYILFVFSTLLFLLSSFGLPRALLCYVDNLSCIGEFAWGVAAYRFLVGAISHYASKNSVYVNGFMAGLVLRAFSYVWLSYLGAGGSSVF